MATYRATIPGPAVEQARPRAARVGGSVRVYDPSKVRNYKAYAKMVLEKYKLERLLDGALWMDVEVYILRPKSWPKKRLYADTKPDADNFAKMICDICEKFIYTNDSRIVDLRIRKVLTTDNPRVEIEIGELEEE